MAPLNPRSRPGLATSMLATALVITFCACSSCPDGLTDNLPKMSCEPVPLDQDGCLGLPREVVGPDTKRFPLDCMVRERETSAQCGVQSFVCTDRDLPQGSPPVWRATVAL